MRRVVVAAVLLAACGSFEDPSIVLDLRIIAMTAHPPEQVALFDPEDPLATEFEDVEICAKVADPGRDRRLVVSMTACPPQNGRRCWDDRPSVALEGGAEVVIGDPESQDGPWLPCFVLPGGPGLIELLRDTIEHDAVSGFGGIDLTVSMRVVPEGGGEEEAVYGFKSARYSPLLPADRVANSNPYIDHFAIAEGGIEIAALRPGRCRDHPSPHIVGASETLTIVPIEPEGVREDYVLPTFDGGSRRFTEYISYQWLATGGDWSRASSGGPRDPAGNEPSLGATWQAPSFDDLDGTVSHPLWVIYRDERGGGGWLESCVRVFP